jgi:hypothetical protein
MIPINRFLHFLEIQASNLEERQQEQRQQLANGVKKK